MVVNYDIEDGWSTILDLFKSTPKITDEAKQSLERLKNVTSDDFNSIERLSQALRTTNKDFLEFAKQADLSGDLVQQYTDYMKFGTSAAKKFGAAIKSIGANMAIMLAINLVATFAYKAWDNFAHAAENAKEEMDEAVAAYEENKSNLKASTKS